MQHVLARASSRGRRRGGGLLLCCCCCLATSAAAARSGPVLLGAVPGGGGAAVAAWMHRMAALGRAAEAIQHSGSHCFAPRHQQQQQQLPPRLSFLTAAPPWGPLLYVGRPHGSSSTLLLGAVVAGGGGGGRSGGNNSDGPSLKVLQRAPRLYCPDSPLRAAAPLVPSPDQAHYVTKVMRLRPGDWLRAFNARDGEWACRLDGGGGGGGRRVGGKRGARGESAGGGPMTATVERQLRAPLPPGGEPGLRLCFGMIKRARLKTLCEKATELGVTVLQPIITEYVDLREGGEELLTKMESTLIEAAEQCERLSIPLLLPPVPLASLLGEEDKEKGSVLYVCRERAGDGRAAARPLLSALDADAATLFEPGALPSFLIGPEGGFSPAELAAFDAAAPSRLRCVSLGPTVLRAETAGAAALAGFQMWRDARVVGEEEARGDKRAEEQ